MVGPTAADISVTVLSCLDLLGLMKQEDKVDSALGAGLMRMSWQSQPDHISVVRVYGGWAMIRQLPDVALLPLEDQLLPHRL